MTAAPSSSPETIAVRRSALTATTVGSRGRRMPWGISMRSRRGVPPRSTIGQRWRPDAPHVRRERRPTEEVKPTEVVSPIGRNASSRPEPKSQRRSPSPMPTASRPSSPMSAR